MVVRNDMDRYRLVMDVLDRVPSLAGRTEGLRQAMTDQRIRHHNWIREHGTDLPEVADWSWRVLSTRGAVPHGPSGAVYGTVRPSPPGYERRRLEGPFERRPS